MFEYQQKVWSSLIVESVVLRLTGKVEFPPKISLALLYGSGQTARCQMATKPSTLQHS